MKSTIESVWNRVAAPLQRLTSQPLLPMILALLILMAAFAARFHLLGHQSLWHDEGNSYVQATRSFASIADNAARDIHPPGYYWLLAIWHLLTGDSEFALRALSAFASLLSLAFTYALGKRLFSPLTAVVAVGFVALNTFHIYYAQEARMYALMALWGVASMWVLAGLILSYRDLEIKQENTHDLLASWRSSPSFRWALALALFNAAGLWTQYAFAFVLLAQGLLAALWFGSEIYDVYRRDKASLISTLRLLGYYIAANLLLMLLFLPWLPTAWDQITHWPNTGQDIPSSEALSKILGWLAFGVTAEPGTTSTVAFFLLFGLLDLPESIQRQSVKRAWWRMLVPVLWMVLTVGAFLALGLFREANLKFLLPAQMAFALWMGRGVWVLWTLRVRRESALLRATPRLAALLGTFAVFVGLWNGLSPLYDDPAYQRADYRAIASAITENARPGDAIILSAPNQQEVFDYYYLGDASVFPLPRGLGGDDLATLAETRAVINDYARIFAVLWGTNERDPNNVVEGTLDAEAFETSDTWYGDVRLVRYATPVEFNDVAESGAQFGDHITLQRYAVSNTQVQPGDVLQIQLEWSTDAPLNMNYKVFVQLIAPDGFLAAQHDSEPVGNTAPTSGWSPSETIIDNHGLIIPDNLPPANYTLIIGLYNRDDSLSRLAVNNGDFLTLESIEVQ